MEGKKDASVFQGVCGSKISAKYSSRKGLKGCEKETAAYFPGKNG